MFKEKSSIGLGAAFLVYADFFIAKLLIMRLRSTSDDSRTPDRIY